MPLPVIATTVHEKTLFLSQKAYRNTIDLAQQADLTFVGVGTVDAEAAMVRDGFIKPDEARALARAGAVGEILGWAYGERGTLIDGLTNDRVLSVPLKQPAGRRVVAVAMAMPRLPAIRGALLGNLVNGLITNEAMAQRLIDR
jgi:DNA-binding transcriptional regulator LsrR (DeoR family)